MKLAGKKVKAAYVQDDDLMEDGGVIKEGTIEFMNWYIGWLKPIRGKMNICMSIPNEFSKIKGVDDFVFLDIFEKIDQDIDAKPYLREILSKADELGVSVVLEPIPRHNKFLDNTAKRNKIDRQYLIGYYSKFGFSLMDNGLMHRKPGTVMAGGAVMSKLIVCRACGWRWNTADSDESDKYVCHQCGFDNRTYYDADPIGTYAHGGQVLDLINQGIVELKMFDTTPEHAKEYGLDSKRPLYLQKIYISKHDRLKGIGSKVIEYIIDYAKKNEHDLIFGHITQESEPNIDVIKSMLREAGFNTIEANNDFYKTIDTKYADGGLIAPNGNPSNLTPEQYRLVRTPEFKAWFGDWDTQYLSKLIAQEDGRLIYEGVDIGILETHVVEDKVVEIDRLYIDDKYQKKGIGRASIKYVFDKYGCDKIIAYPHPKSDPFWLKSGVSNVTMEGYFEIPKSAYDCSKIVDDNGEPKVVYHGSRSQFTTFDLSKGGESNTLARVGFWFSPNEGFGLNFTAGTWWGDIKGDYGIEYAVFLSIKNPKVFVPGEPGELFSDSYERFKTDIYALAGQSARDANIGGLGMALNNAKQTINDYRSMLKKDGYDGILIKQTRFDKRTAGDLNDQIVALYPEQIKLADGSNVTFDPNNPDIRFDEGGKIEKMAETLELIQEPAQYAAGGATDDCGCGKKAEDGMEVETKELPVGKLAKGLTIEQIAKMHRYSPFLLRKNLRDGIKTEMEHTDDKDIAEAIALDHLYEDPEYYHKLKMVEKFQFGTPGWEQASSAMGGVPDHEAIEIKHYIFDQRDRALRLVYSNEPKISRFMICFKLYEAAKMYENSAENDLEKNMWNEVVEIWKNAMNDVKNGNKYLPYKDEEIMSFNDIFVYGKGGLLYGNSHANGGIPLLNKSTNSMIEVEGGEGVLNKRSMQMTKKMEFEGEKLTACEIISKINVMGGGVKFKCSDVKPIINNDGKFA